MTNPINIILFILGLINALALVMVGVDKNRSRQQDDRVPEVYFFVWASLFSSLGVLVGMFLFRHKTRKFYFLLGITFLLFQQILLLTLLINFINN